MAEALGWWSACRSSHYSPSACPCPAAWAASTPPPLQLDSLQTSTTQVPHTWAWLPAELHTTPFSSCSGVRRLILLNAPRTLKERTGCKERGSEWTGDRQRGQKGLKAPITMKEGTGCRREWNEGGKEGQSARGYPWHAACAIAKITLNWSCRGHFKAPNMLQSRLPAGAHATANSCCLEVPSQLCPH